MITRPMLAENVEEEKELKWPMIASPKVDGIRCVNPDGRILSRSFKPIPNHYIRTTLERLLPSGADGELFSGNTFNKVTSDVMSQDGEPDFKFWMFDYIKDGLLELPYFLRLQNMVDLMRNASSEQKKFIGILPFKHIESLEALKEYEKQMLGEGFEGVCLRTPNSPYKCGRSTWREKYLLKLKIFLDSEALVLGTEEQMSNLNSLGKDELGLAKRSSSKVGKIPAGRLGKFLVKDLKTGVEFKCGTGKGLTIELRQEIWDNRGDYIGKIIKYKYQPHGVKDKPRCPIWLGFRDPRDM